jgi:hypothetical protein
VDWFAQIDGYCERTDFAYWSEPLNALSNLAFLIAALILWRRSADVPVARALCAILFFIGVGSFLFHTSAAIWASAADVVPIGIFIFVYLFAVNRDVVPMGHGRAVFATALFVPYAAILVPILNQFPFIRISNFYWSVPILLGIYALLLRRKPGIARGFVIGAGLLSLSIIIRSLDETLCEAIPIGTHFLWHVLNAIMLGFMIHVYTRHMLAAAPTER